MQNLKTLIFSFTNLLIILLLQISFLQLNSKSIKPVEKKTFFATENDAIRNKDTILFHPDRNVQSSTYFDYSFDRLLFESVYGKKLDSSQEIICLVQEKNSQKMFPKNKMEASPQDGFILVSFKCSIPKEKLFEYHLELFESKPEFNRFGIGFIISHIGWIAVNQKGNILFEVFNFDNGPDPIEEGLFRFLQNGKMGFADESGKIRIPAIYDWVEPFHNGKASICEGCVRKYEGEHFRMEGGVWKTITKPKL